MKEMDVFLIGILLNSDMSEWMSRNRKGGAREGIKHFILIFISSIYVSFDSLDYNNDQVLFVHLTVYVKPIQQTFYTIVRTPFVFALTLSVTWPTVSCKRHVKGVDIIIDIKCGLGVVVICSVTLAYWTSKLTTMHSMAISESLCPLYYIKYIYICCAVRTNASSCYTLCEGERTAWNCLMYVRVLSVNEVHGIAP